MGEEISSPFQLTIREFDILQKSLTARENKLRADAKRCWKSYEGKVTTETKAKAYMTEAEELHELELKIVQEFS